MTYQPNFPRSPSRAEFADNRVWRVLKHSIELFHETGMQDLARKWEKILHNYEKKQRRVALLTRAPSPGVDRPSPSW